MPRPQVRSDFATRLLLARRLLQGPRRPRLGRQHPQARPTGRPRRRHSAGPFESHRRCFSTARRRTFRQGRGRRKSSEGKREIQRNRRSRGQCGQGRHRRRHRHALTREAETDFRQAHHPRQLRSRLGRGRRYTLRDQLRQSCTRRRVAHGPQRACRRRPARPAPRGQPGTAGQFRRRRIAAHRAHDRESVCLFSSRSCSTATRREPPVYQRAKNQARDLGRSRRLWPRGGEGRHRRRPDARPRQLHAARNRRRCHGPRERQALLRTHRRTERRCRVVGSHRHRLHQPECRRRSAAELRRVGYRATEFWPRRGRPAVTARSHFPHRTFGHPADDRGEGPRRAIPPRLHYGTTPRDA